MPHVRNVHLVVAALTAATLACNGDSPGGSSGGSLNASLAVGLLNPDFDGTLSRAQMFWDGALVADVSASPPTFDMGLPASVKTSPGTHTLSFKIVSQTASPITYSTLVSAYAYDLNGGSYQSVDVPIANRSLATGTTTSFTVIFH
jgi:hypothetical protein